MPGAGPDPEPSTEQMRAVQVERAREEARAAASSPDDEEAAQHARRADKASYLRDKLAERSRSEQQQSPDRTD